MYQISDEKQDFLFQFPLPTVDIDANKLTELMGSFGKEGLVLGIRTEQAYPVAACFVEITIGVASFVVGALASHYAEMVFNVLDSTLKKQYDIISTRICRKDKEVVITIRRANLDEAKKLLSEALSKLEDAE